MMRDTKVKLVFIMITGNVFDIKELTVYEGDGLNITVFLKGCPLQCVWCHNPEGIDPRIRHYKNGIVVGRQYTAMELADRLAAYVEIQESIGGYIIFSGGEPLAQTDFLIETIKYMNSAKIAIDTCGYTDPNNIRKISEYTDIFYYDLKLAHGGLHKQYTTKSNRIILENLLLLDQRNKPIIIRIPIIPGITDGSENINEIIQIIDKCSHIHQIDLVSYNPYTKSKYQTLGLDFIDIKEPLHEIDMSSFEHFSIPVRYLEV